MKPRTNIKHIAAETGFSLFTVSKVLNGLAGEARISAATRDAVLAAARRLNYQPSAAARSIRSSRTHLVGILIRNSPADPLNYPIAYEIILGIDDALCRAGYATTLVRISDVASMRAQSLAFREHALDAMIVMDQLPADVHRHVADVMPVCLWVESDVWRARDCLRRDDAAVGRGVVRQAETMGYRRLFISPRPRAGLHYALHERYEAMVMEARRLKLPVTSRPALDDAGLGAALRALRPDTAMITSGSWDAAPLARLAAEHGKLPGRDYGLAATDEDEQIRKGWPELSRYAFDRFGLGQTAANLLLERLKGRPSVPSCHIASAWIPGQTLRKVHG
jgi:DNA-binding LacI/PurR family transcriptional regulator